VVYIRVSEIQHSRPIPCLPRSVNADMGIAVTDFYRFDVAKANTKRR